ncbi:MAG: flagellar biosynthesis anti-sigma factor FlgM [Oceanococcus sp.]|nr:MAG: flagellar biosynthesis anti-sigma factor FlgM [Oceanococcus sp.]
MNKIQQHSLQYLATRPLSKESTPGAASAPAQGREGGDRLSLSNQADRLAALSQIAANSPDIDAGRVESLRQAIANGEYTVDPDALASRMLGNARELDTVKS